MTCMSYEKFQYIMNILIDFKNQRKRISDFIQKEISTSTYCVCDIGNHIETCLINILADEFNCWYSFNGRKDYNWWKNNSGLENDIETWLYGLDDKKLIIVNNIEHDVTNLLDFYKFLVQQNKQL